MRPSFLGLLALVATSLPAQRIGLGVVIDSAAARRSVALGDSSRVGGTGEPFGEITCVGFAADCGAARVTSVGSRNVAGLSAALLGRGVRCLPSHGVCLGRGAYLPEGWANAITIGFSGGSLPLHVGFDNWAAARYFDPIDGVVVSRVPAKSPVILHGMSGWDELGKIVDQRGGDISIMPGAGTGSASSGQVCVFHGPAGGRSGGSVRHPKMVACWSFPTNPRETSAVLYAAGIGLVRVQMTAPDSIGRQFLFVKR